MTSVIRKAIIPAAGLGTRFLPISKVLPKELLPLAGSPMIEYVVKEAKDAELSQIVFVLSESKKMILDYFKKKPKLESNLKKRNQKELYERMKKFDQEFEPLSFTAAFQAVPRGDGDAVLRAKKQAGKDAFAVLFPDDVFEAKIPAISQLKKIFRTSQKPVIGLKRISQEKLSAYGVVKVEKIANRLYKIKELVEKPAPGRAPSDLAICGRYILPHETFSYLAKTLVNQKGEIILAEALRMMLRDGKVIYGYELEGEWLECGKTIDWLKSNLYLSLRHPEYGPVLREFLKKIK